MPRASTALLLALALLLAGAAAGCGGSSGPSAEELVTRSAEQTSQVKSFHVLVDVENVPSSRTGLSLTYVDGDVVVPDKVKAKIGGSFLGLSVSTDLVVVGSTYYLKIPFTGKWRTIEVGTLPVAFFDPSTGVLNVIEKAQGLKRAGSEDVGGVPCHRVTGTVPASALKPLLSTAEGDAQVPIELWIGKDDFLLRRLRLTGPISPSEGQDAVRTIELSNFDEPVSITAPSAS